MSFLQYAGALKAHKDWVTCMELVNDTLVSGSRDKRLIAWDLTYTEDNQVGVAKKSMTGHSHFVSDLAVDAQGVNAISSSWDGTLRLWNIENGQCQQRFVGHTRDVQTVCLDKKEKRVYSGASDNTVRVWSVDGKEMGRTKAENVPHRDWVSCVRTLVINDEEFVVATGWDRTIRVWKSTENAGLTGKANIYVGPEGVITKCATIDNKIVAIAKDGSIRCITVNTDGDNVTFDEEVIETEHKNLYDIVLHPTGTAAFVAADSKILVINLSGEFSVISEETAADEEGIKKKARSLAIDNGSRLYVGETQGSILVFDISQE